MNLKEFLLKQKGEILKAWFRLTLETYSADVPNLLEKGKDRFANPVGYTISNAMEALYERLLQEKPLEQLQDPLERIIQIRSVARLSLWGG